MGSPSKFSYGLLQRQSGDILEELVSVFLSYRAQGLVEDPTYVTHGTVYIDNICWFLISWGTFL